MMTAIVMVMHPACGPSPLTQPLMMDAQLFMMKAALPRSLRLSAMAGRETQKQGW